MENINDIYFSQSALNTFKACPLLFKRKHLEGLFWGGQEDSAKAEKMEQGRLFHLIAERYFSNIPTGIESMDSEEPLVQWTKALMQALPLKEDIKYYPEYELRLNVGTMKLLAKYDLILKSNNCYRIYDWKTDSKPLKVNEIANSLQTILYRFLLVEASQAICRDGIKPESIEMYYWQPISTSPVILTYSKDLYEKDRWLVENLVNDILTYDFEKCHEKIDRKYCRFCEISRICKEK